MTKLYRKLSIKLKIKYYRSVCSQIVSNTYIAHNAFLDVSHKGLTINHVKES